MYIIKHLRMKSYLEGLGFECKGVLPDRNNKRFNVFMFQDSEELRQALTNYKK